MSERVDVRIDLSRVSILPPIPDKDARKHLDFGKSACLLCLPSSDLRQMGANLGAQARDLINLIRPRVTDPSRTAEAVSCRGWERDVRSGIVVTCC